MKIHKQIKEQVFCDMCGIEFTGKSLIEYMVHDVGEHEVLVGMTIKAEGVLADIDLCEVCKAKAMLWGILRRFQITDDIYPLFSTKKDEHGMDNFIKKILKPNWTKWGVDWTYFRNIIRFKKRKK